MGRLVKREPRGGSADPHGGFGGTRERRRFLANHADEATLGSLSSWDVEPVGRRGWVWTIEEQGKRRNAFSFEKPVDIQGRERGNARL